MRQVLGHRRLPGATRCRSCGPRSTALYYYEVLADEVWYDKVVSISEPELG